VWVYNAKFVESIEIWTLISMVLLFIVVLAFARSLGPISPTFPEAGATWLDWAKRFGPTALVGYVLGWLIWPLRVDTYESFWMPLVGAGLALFIRSIYLQIRHGRTPVESAPPPAGAQLAGAAEAGGPISSTISTEVN
jgi:branched-chain amino acid transport system permease protein